jgi:hypothetical protein
MKRSTTLMFGVATLLIASSARAQGQDYYFNDVQLSKSDRIVLNLIGSMAKKPEFEARGLLVLQFPGGGTLVGKDAEKYFTDGNPISGIALAGMPARAMASLGLGRQQMRANLEGLVAMAKKNPIVQDMLNTAAQDPAFKSAAESYNLGSPKLLQKLNQIAEAKQDPRYSQAVWALGSGAAPMAVLLNGFGYTQADGAQHYWGMVKEIAQGTAPKIPFDKQGNPLAFVTVKDSKSGKDVKVPTDPVHYNFARLIIPRLQKLSTSYNLAQMTPEQRTAMMQHPILGAASGLKGIVGHCAGGLQGQALRQIVASLGDVKKADGTPVVPFAKDWAESSALVTYGIAPGLPGKEYGAYRFVLSREDPFGVMNSTPQGVARADIAAVHNHMLAKHNYNALTGAPPIKAVSIYDVIGNPFVDLTPPAPKADAAALAAKAKEYRNAAAEYGKRLPGFSTGNELWRNAVAMWSPAMAGMIPTFSRSEQLTHEMLKARADLYDAQAELARAPERDKAYLQSKVRSAESRINSVVQMYPANQLLGASEYMRLSLSNKGGMTNRDQEIEKQLGAKEIARRELANLPHHKAQMAMMKSGDWMQEKAAFQMQVVTLKSQKSELENLLAQNATALAKPRLAAKERTRLLEEKQKLEVAIPMMEKQIQASIKILPAVTAEGRVVNGLYRLAYDSKKGIESMMAHNERINLASLKLQLAIQKNMVQPVNADEAKAYKKNWLKIDGNLARLDAAVTRLETAAALRSPGDQSKISDEALNYALAKVAKQRTFTMARLSWVGAPKEERAKMIQSLRSQSKVLLQQRKAMMAAEAKRPDVIKLVIGAPRVRR